MRLRNLLFFVVFCLATSISVAETGDEYSLYLVRHAEKQADGSRDPELTQAGKKRSFQLAHWLQNKNIDEIWSSDYKRTRNTAMPLATRLHYELNIYDPRDQSVLVEDLTQSRNNAFIVGHSNTIPELARQLCDCFIADMEESEYDRMIIISSGHTGIQVKTLQQQQLFQSED